MVNSYSGILVAFSLVVGGIVWAAIWIAWRIRPRQFSTLGYYRSFDGSTHIIPGEGHVEAEDCACNPRVDDGPGELLVEHRPLGTVQR